jgi:hypothetical protein
MGQFSQLNYLTLLRYFLVNQSVYQFRRLFQWTDWELTVTVDSLNADSAPDYHGLSSKLIKASFPVIKEQLLYVINACFLLTLFLGSWKVCKFTVIDKQNKPSYKSLSSFRQISLVSNLAKLLKE